MSQFQTWNLSDPVGSAADLTSAIQTLANDILAILADLLDPLDSAMSWVDDQLRMVKKALADAALSQSVVAETELQSVLDVLALHASSMSAEATAELAQVQQALIGLGVPQSSTPVLYPEPMPGPSGNAPDPLTLLPPTPGAQSSTQQIGNASISIVGGCTVGQPLLDFLLMHPEVTIVRIDPSGATVTAQEAIDYETGTVWAGDCSATWLAPRARVPSPPPPPDTLPIPSPIPPSPIPAPAPSPVACPPCPTPEPAAPPIPCGPCGPDVIEEVYDGLYAMLMSALPQVSSAIATRLLATGKPAQSDSLLERQAAQTLLQCAATILGASCGGASGGEQSVDLDQPHVLKMDERAESWHAQLRAFYGRTMDEFLDAQTMMEYIQVSNLDR